MATKFASIYKQELKSKGALSSMGSAVLKSARERMDVRNIFFGGKGMLSATGQKMFGRGYSALSGGMATPSNSQMAAQSAATGELISSNERQEALLRVVAKNTFNMNMMARDMNITRQNIATLTRMMAGKAAQSQDALWYDVKTRNQAIDSLGKKRSDADSKSPSKSSGSSFFGSILGGAGSVLGAIGSVLGSVLGTVGSGVLGVFKTVMALSPILAIIGLAASAYVIQQLSKLDFGLDKIIDLESVKKRLYDAIGYDPKSEKTFTEQMANKLDEMFKTTKFSEGTKFIEKTFGPLADDIGRSISIISDTTLVYIGAAYQTLADSFSNTGKLMAFYFKDFFDKNQSAILAVIGGMVGARLGLKGAAAGAVIGGILGELNADVPLEKLPEEIVKRRAELTKDVNTFFPNQPRKLVELLKKREEGKEFTEELTEKERRLLRKYDNLMDLEERLAGYNEAQTGIRTNPAESFRKSFEEQMRNLPGGRPGGSYVPKFNLDDHAARGLDQGLENRQSSTAPSRLSIGQRIGDFPITSLFGMRTNAITGQGMEDHKGIDIAMPPGTPLYAVVDGKVTAVGHNDVAGNFVTIRDSKGTEYSYSHLSSQGVKVGQEVKRGDLIAKSGGARGAPGSGRSSGPHLHFGVKENNNYREPLLQELESAVPKSQKMSQLIMDNQELLRSLMAPDASGGTTVVAPQNTTVVAGGASQGFAGAIDAEAIYLFTSRIG
jgi:murein DD-endopeptidase MepM/ murein hydrolase activator NlpD